MRALFILAGAPGSGKTTLINRLGVSDLALGFDQMRAHFGTVVPCVDVDGGNAVEGLTPRLTAAAERAVVQATHAALEARMEAGATVFFDSAATSRRCKELASHADRHGYKTYIIDVQGQTTFEELCMRNAGRGAERVGAEALRPMWDAGKALNGNNIEVIDGQNFNHLQTRIQEITRVKHITMGRTVVVGDIHSCATPLVRAIRDHDTPDTMWVFSGDLFDRGSQPVAVWLSVQALLHEGRAVTVVGNHDTHLRTVNNAQHGGSLRDTVVTRNALLAAGITKAEQVKFVNSMEPAVVIERPGSPWIVTHGGVGNHTAKLLLSDGLLHISESECVYGIGHRESTYRGKSSYDVEQVAVAGNQLHGHRNGRIGHTPVPAIRYESQMPVVCLESGIGSGGHLTVAVFDHGCDMPEIHQYPDGVDKDVAARNRTASWDRTSNVTTEHDTRLLDEMIASPHVRVTPVPGLENVVAANFTRTAFREGAWDHTSTHARGLFIDQTTGAVLARGYQKFFHMGEAPGRSREHWEDSSITAYPVTSVKKFNGFLALVASIHGKLSVFTKSGITDYSKVAENMLRGSLSERSIEDLRVILERSRTTALFEVIRSDDPHPVAEPGADRLVLLDVVYNRADFAVHEGLSVGLAAKFGFESARDHIAFTAHSPSEFGPLCDAAAARCDEGVVIIDARGYRSKIKADEYAARKSARGALERYWKGVTDTLGPRHADLEARLRATGALDGIRDGRFTVIGPGGAGLDVAAVFDRGLQRP